MTYKPLHTLLFLAFAFALLSILAYAFPKDGLSITDNFVLKFPQLSTFFESDSVSKKADISKVLAFVDSLENKDEEFADSSLVKVIETSDSTPAKTNHKIFNTSIPVDTNLKLLTNIQYKNETKSALHNFFNALVNLNSEPKSVRVLYYGDSQVEGDRFSDYIRMKLQNYFGGEGPGLISLMPIAPSVINQISFSEGWVRYGIFTSPDSRVPINNYGVMAQFCKFTPFKKANDTIYNETSASVKITTSKNGGNKASAYAKLKLFYGGAKYKTAFEFYDGGVLKESDSLQKGGVFNIKEFNVSQNTLNHELRLKGKDSPDFYAASLEGGKGVMVDNIGLRGSSGTFFNKINFSQLKQFYDYLNVRLVVLQFGGNTLPYLKDKAQAISYAGYLKSQIYTIKKLAPQASILVVGPSDMSVKEETEYVTHPLLEDLRDAIKQAAFDTDCAFFDMYDCMGGRNSMVTWVEKGIAAKDYIHFSAGGARKIATLLYSSLINDYNAYIKTTVKK